MGLEKERVEKQKSILGGEQNEQRDRDIWQERREIL